MKKLLLSNIRLKLLALAFATALWFFVAGQSDTEVGFLVPLAFKGIPKEMVMTSSPPEDAEVRVAGPKFIINNLSPSQIIAEIDLSSAKEGLNTFSLQPRDVSTPIGVEVLRVRPSSIDVRMENLINVNLPVRVTLIGKPAAGYRVADVTVSPKTVVASGTKKDIKTMGGVYTRPVDISGLDASANFTARLDVPLHEFRSVSTDAVNVRVKIERER
ncbi:MAG: YbbR-like domain-containing protein [Deltaproteobacteria bacterium]|nr:YbbR-like domain-containing protein [Deltaproteobacteria bacterium]